MPAIAISDHHVQTTDTNAQQNIQHRSSKTRAQRHNGVAQAGDSDVSDEIAEGVTDSEDGETEDGVADTEDDAEGFEDADDLVGDGGDPADADDEAEEAEEEAVARGFGGGGGEEEKAEGGEGADERVECWKEEGAGGEVRVGVGPDEEDDEEGGGEDLGGDEPAVPLFGRRWGRGCWIGRIGRCGEVLLERRGRWLGVVVVVRSFCRGGDGGGVAVTTKSLGRRRAETVVSMPPNIWTIRLRVLEITVRRPNAGAVGWGDNHTM